MKLPPMNALRMFEAVSRLGSVSKAAEELCVSQGAVSQQLKNLEDSLGQLLFHRKANALRLTDEGQAFAAVVQQSLAQIAQAADLLSQEQSPQCLRISAPPGLSLKWLMPRLGGFYEKYPDVAVVLDESLDLVTFNNDGFDAAIRFSDGRFKNLVAAPLIALVGCTVASPKYVDNHGELDSVRQPIGHSLIDQIDNSKKIRSQHLSWDDLLDKSIEELDCRHLVFPNALQALNAATQGLGVALLPRYFCEEDVRAGTLVYQDDPGFTYCNRYYFVSPDWVRPNPALDKFRDWLVEISRPHR